MGDIRNSISKNIMLYRKKLDLTQEELANKISVKKTSVSSWERNANAPDIETLYKLCKLFHISLEEMYGVDNHKNVIISENKYIKNENSPKILEYYNLLNNYGKKEAEKRVKELTCISDYTVLEFIRPIAVHTDHTSEESLRAIEEKIEGFDDLP